MTTSLPRALRLVIGFSPGSLSDQIARIFADALADTCGVAVTIDRRAGGNGIPAARAVVAGAADGSQVFMATLGTHAIAPLLQTPSPYDPLHDFAAVALLTQSPLLLACNPALGVRTVGELIARARREPVLTYATSAIGGAPHLAAELFQSLTGTTLRHVRYDETETLYRDLEAGTVALSFNNIASMLPRCRRGALTALGVTAAVRSVAAPELPTLDECGVAGYAMSNWTGVVTSAATPPALVAALAAQITAAMRSESMNALLEVQGITACGGTPQAFADFMAAERARWRDVVARFRHTDEAA